MKCGRQFAARLRIDLARFGYSSTKIFFLAEISLEDLRPNRDADFSQVSFAEVILADRAHLGADALSVGAAELLKRRPFPLGGCLHDLCIDGMLVAVIRNMELDGSA
jgi:hypothetical protein